MFCKFFLEIIFSGKFALDHEQNQAQNNLEFILKKLIDTKIDLKKLRKLQQLLLRFCLKKIAFIEQI